MILTNSSSMNELIPFYQSFTCTDFQSLLESIAGVWLSSSQVYSLHVSFWLLNWWLIFLLFKRLQRRERPSEQADDDRRTCANQQWTSTTNSYWHAPNMQQLWKQVTTVQNHKIRFTEKVLVTDILEKTVMKSWLRKKLDHDGSHYYYQPQPDLLKTVLNMLHPQRKTPPPHLPSFSEQRCQRPVPALTPRLWAALPGGSTDPPGSLCSHRRHGCSPIFSQVFPFSSPSLCVRGEVSSRCCWQRFVVAAMKQKSHSRKQTITSARVL